MMVIMCFFRYGIIHPLLRKIDFNLTLNHTMFVVLLLAVALVASGGYIINNIVDKDIDNVNNQKKCVVGERKPISVNLAKRFYIGHTFLGLLLGAIIACYISSMSLLIYFFVGVLSLYLYSLYWKNSVLWGNLLIATLSASLVWIVMLSDRNFFTAVEIIDIMHISVVKLILILTGTYSFFIFFTTLFREIIKDMEDIEGDAQAGLQTLPVQIGVFRSKCLLYIIWFIVFAVLVLIFVKTYFSCPLLYAYLLVLVIYMFFLLLFIFFAENKEDFTMLSTLIKGYMFLGTLSMWIVYLCLN